MKKKRATRDVQYLRRFFTKLRREPRRLSEEFVSASIKLERYKAILQVVFSECVKCKCPLMIGDANKEFYILACNYSTCTQYRTPIMAVSKQELFDVGIGQKEKVVVKRRR